MAADEDEVEDIEIMERGLSVLKEAHASQLQVTPYFGINMLPYGTWGP